MIELDRRNARRHPEDSLEVFDVDSLQISSRISFLPLVFVVGITKFAKSRLGYLLFGPVSSCLATGENPTTDIDAIRDFKTTGN
jgi:hypothetical protein